MTRRSPGLSSHFMIDVAQRAVDELLLGAVARGRAGMASGMMDYTDAAQTASRVFASTASLARMQARAEWIARSGPQARGLPVRTAEQKPEISRR